MEELNIIDDFLMTAIAANREVGEHFCRLLLTTLLGREVGRIRVHTQMAVPASRPEMRGIRMDVEVEEELPEGSIPGMNIYDMEPHIPKEGNLARHNRFYQAKVDGRYVRSGEKNFSRMPNLYVLTILPYDPFGYDYMVYTVRNRCSEVPELPYDDGLEFLYFNASGSLGGNEKLKELLKYIIDSRAENAVNEELRDIHRCVDRVKMEPEVEKAYMELGDLIDWERAEAAKEAAEKVRREFAGAIAQKEEIIMKKDRELTELRQQLEELQAFVKK